MRIWLLQSAYRVEVMNKNIRIYANPVSTSNSATAESKVAMAVEPKPQCDGTG